MADLPPALASLLDPETVDEIERLDMVGVATLLAIIGATQTRATARLLALGACTDTESSPNSSQWLTAEQVAERVGMSTDWVYRRANRLPFARRIGRSLRFSAEGLERWMHLRNR